LFHRLGVTLLEFLWQGTLVALVWGAVRAMLARAKPSARYAAGCVALVAMISIPTWTFLTAPSAAPDRPLSDRFLSATGGERSAAVTGAPVSDTNRITLEKVRGFARQLEPWPVVIWAVGVVLLCLRFLTGWAAVARLRRGAEILASESLQRALTEIA